MSWIKNWEYSISIIHFSVSFCLRIMYTNANQIGWAVKLEVHWKHWCFSTLHMGLDSLPLLKKHECSKLFHAVCRFFHKSELLFWETTWNDKKMSQYVRLVISVNHVNTLKMYFYRYSLFIKKNHNDKTNQKKKTKHFLTKVDRNHNFTKLSRWLSKEIYNTY